MHPIGIVRGQHKEARSHNASTARLIQYDPEFRKQTSWVRAETVEARTSKRAKALAFKVRRNY
ncbi:hypothetical protein Anas_07547 [Armadillidium nasatum]|uniref:Uncharacterized protein n=1 Tax=Armadillidium nasatum TaxID=96803 RepID=A0A5N5TDG9_9CRUS|nr:hypothetical protein Anas_07547 [Armadillidium nasatum]